jgi:hypothetical protein
MSWSTFCDAVAALPEGQLWRHNEAGDLPGKGDRIDVNAMAALVAANDGRRGFTFTHKPVLDDDDEHVRPTALNRACVRAANRMGFTVNLSADSLEQADRLAALGVGPVVVVLPQGASNGASKTPGGRQVVVCPAQTTKGMTCARCQLCANATRKSIVGFKAHGQFRASVTQLVQLGRKS